MLSITAEALAVMRRVTAHSKIEPTAGLRISRHSDSAEPLQVRAVHRPRPGDTVQERDGALLYLGPDAARRMDGRELDAVTDSDGRVQFILKAAA